MRRTSCRTTAILFLGWLSVVAAVRSAEPTGTVTLLRVPAQGIQPQVVLDSKGVVHLIYFRGEPAQGDIFYVSSHDGGAHFTAPLRVNSLAGSAIATGNIRGAHLALGKNGRVHVAWMGSGKAKSTTHGAPMLYARLTDDKSAFEPERNMIEIAAGLDGGGSLGADDLGNVSVVWHAPLPGAKGEENRRVWVKRSKDKAKPLHEK